jgi:hypothetical protein
MGAASGRAKATLSRDSSCASLKIGTGRDLGLALLFQQDLWGAGLTRLRVLLKRPLGAQGQGSPVEMVCLTNQRKSPDHYGHRPGRFRTANPPNSSTITYT